MATASDASPQHRTFCKVTVAEVEETFEGLSPSKSAGVKSIYPAELISLEALVLSLFNKLFDHSLLTGVIPTKWRAAIIVLIS